ncbi:MAG: Mur ligase family protein, partial [Chloroflexi bacterium]|nr:Mur ligase family protein [Chloroflexota bacterium]
MDYKSAVAWLLGLTNYETIQPAPAAPADPPRWDLGRVEALLHALGNPHLGRATLHVAGTKGKGSTVTLLAAALTASGQTTGRFTSPHLHSIRERIAVGDRPITADEFARIATELRPSVEAIDGDRTSGRLTTFEVLTTMAFLHFRACQATIQVVEVGLGGRLDATNVVAPTVTAITSLSMDHEAYLGHTLREIATEKAGIIKPGVPVVSAPQAPEALDVIEARCVELGAPLTILGRDIFWRSEGGNLDGQDFRVWGKVGGGPFDHALRTRLLGPHQLENAAL